MILSIIINIQKINKTISTRVLEEWMKKCSEFLEQKGVIKCHEFLYLMCNTVNRQSFVRKELLVWRVMNTLFSLIMYLKLI